MQKIKIVKKPWGKELWFAVTKKYVGKILIIKKGCRLSLQYHKVKEETLLLEEGLLKLTTGTKINKLKTKIIKPGTVFHILPEIIHRTEALSDCRLVEVSTPHLTDVVRIQDDYNRGNK
jgi:mannose-6-phosphate isomerase